MLRIEINYTHEEQDEQRYEREREWWLEAVADRRRPRAKEDKRQMILPLIFEETEGGQ